MAADTRRGVILHQAMPPDAPPDEQDALEQVGAVDAALSEAGWRTRRVAAGLDLGHSLGRPNAGG
jgi:hypothetical protein